MTPEHEQLRLKLRKTLREKRSTLQADELAMADKKLGSNIEQLFQLKQFHQKTNRVAGYLANDGEIPLQHSFEILRTLGLQTYVPVIRNEILKFAQLTPQTAFRTGKFGIAVPVCIEADLLEASAIDVILTPLLAFDSSGNRLGMGGGYYDRTFAHLHPANKVAAEAGTGTSKQLFIGVAHAFQKIDHVPIESWDVPLQYAATDCDIFDFSTP